MTVKLLTELNLEFLSLKGDYTGSSECSCQNVTLLEITCHGSSGLRHRRIVPCNISFLEIYCLKNIACFTASNKC